MDKLVKLITTTGVEYAWQHESQILLIEKALKKDTWKGNVPMRLNIDGKIKDVIVTGFEVMTGMN
ncbi:hypothetical protein ACWOE8_07000 [Enterococcus avium]